MAVARSILVVIWNLLHDPATRSCDLGADYHAHPDQHRTQNTQLRHATDGDGLPGHPRTRGLTQIHTGTRRPGSASFAGCCRLPTHPLGHFPVRQQATTFITPCAVKIAALQVATRRTFPAPRRFRRSVLVRQQRVAAVQPPMGAHRLQPQPRRSNRRDTPDEVTLSAAHPVRTIAIVDTRCPASTPLDPRIRNRQTRESKGWLGGGGCVCSNSSVVTQFGNQFVFGQ